MHPSSILVLLALSSCRQSASRTFSSFSFVFLSYIFLTILSVMSCLFFFFFFTLSFLVLLIYYFFFFLLPCLLCLVLNSLYLFIYSLDSVLFLTFIHIPCPSFLFSVFLFFSSHYPLYKFIHCFPFVSSFAQCMHNPLPSPLLCLKGNARRVELYLFDPPPPAIISNFDLGCAEEISSEF